jgi:Na+-driven multidrug efflux pump
LFSTDAEVLATIRLFLWILPAGYGLQGVIILSNSSLNAMHRPLSALMLSVVRFFGLYVPFAWIGSRLMGVEGFFIGAVCANAVMAVISWITVKRVLAQERANCSAA